LIFYVKNAVVHARFTAVHDMLTGPKKPTDTEVSVFAENYVHYCCIFL